MSLTNISELTEGKVGGNGAFDKLMAAGQAHIQREYELQRLRGPEYSQVYLGMIQSSMNTALSFMVQGAKLDLERQLLEQQVLLAELEVQKMGLEKQKLAAELELLQLQKPKMQAEVELMQAQVVQMEAENALIPKKAALMDAEVLYKQKQGEMIISEIANSTKQGELIDSQKLKLAQEVKNLAADELGTKSRTKLTDQQALNAIVEGTVLVAQECKLRAEFDLIQNQMTKTTSEIALVTQKTATEKAQTQTIGVDENSVIGRQKTLYLKQSSGFDRDAEQKLLKILLDTWSARRMTDEATVADGVNQLNDASLGAVVAKAKAGIGA